MSVRAVPDTPDRAVVYVRQSIARDESVSPELQKASCIEYARQQGYQVIEVLEDLGISGRTFKRPAVVKAMCHLEEGRAEVILVWKWSRISRSRRDWALAADRADVAGGRIESSTESVDISTATGRLTRGMLVELAAFESDRIGEIWKEVHHSRIAKGIVPNGNPRFGYQWDPAAGVHVPDPITGPALVAAYERFVAGEPLSRIVRWFNTQGLVTIKGGPWSHRILRRVMDQGFAAGRLTWGGQVFTGAHEVLVPADLWQAYLDRRAIAKTLPPRTKSSQYVLSGLVRCARCKGAMAGGAAPQGPRFRCNRNRDLGSQAGCTGGYVQMSVVEGVVLEWLAEVAARVDDTAAIADKTAAVRISAEVDARRLAVAIGKLDDQLKVLTIQLAEEVVSTEAYVAARDELAVKRARLVDQLEEAGRVGRRASADPAAVAQGLLDGWDEHSVAVRRTVLGELIGRVEVTTATAAGGGGKGGESRAKVAVIPVWDASEF